MIARDSLITLLTRIFNFSLTLTGNIILARLLGASGMGTWAVMLSFLSMMVHLWGPGIAFANVYYVAKGKQSIGQTWAATLLLGFGFGLAAIITGVILVLMRFRSLANIGDKRLVLVILVSLPLMYISSWGIRIIQGMNRISLMNLLDIISQVIYLALLILFLIVFRLGLWGAVLAYCGWHLSATLVLGLTLFRFMGKGEFSLNFDTIRSNITYGLKMYIGKLSNWANNRLDMLIAPLFLNNAQIGQYAMAVTVTEKLWMFPDAMSSAVLPRISADKKGRPELTAQACRLSLIIMFPIALFLIAVGWWFFPLILGPEFRGSYILMLAILPGTMAFGLSRILTTSLVGVNRPATLSGVVAISAFTNIGLNFLLIPWLGVVGCSLASSGSYILEAVMLGFCHCRHHKVDPGSLIFISRTDFKILIDQSKLALDKTFSLLSLSLSKSH